MGGYLLEVFERVPEVGEETNINGFYFRILAASKTRIEKIKLVIKNTGSRKLFSDNELDRDIQDYREEDDYDEK
jgi:Mg2+/Co2+ transporter CorC